jgi:hypothetical protein
VSLVPLRKGVNFYRASNSRMRRAVEGAVFRGCWYTGMTPLINLRHKSLWHQNFPDGHFEQGLPTAKTPPEPRGALDKESCIYVNSIRIKGATNLT